MKASVFTEDENAQNHCQIGNAGLALSAIPSNQEAQIRQTSDQFIATS